MRTAEAEVVAVSAPDHRRRLVRLGGRAFEPIVRSHRPADAVRVDLPDHLTPGGSVLHRVYTLTDVDRASGTAALDVLLDSDGPGARWGDTVAAGDTVIVHGPRYGYDVDPSASRLVLAGDDSATPAIVEICRRAPATTEVHVLRLSAPGIAVSAPGAAGDERFDGVDALLARLGELRPAADETRFWCAGEAALVHAARRLVRADFGVARAHARFAVYWRRGLRLEATQPIEDAERQRISDHGIVLADVHDHDDIEPLVDLVAGPPPRRNPST